MGDRPVAEWPPPEARVQGALFYGESHLWACVYPKAALHFQRAAAAAVDPADRELARGLVHLAAAGCKHRAGNERGCERQLAHARRRLASFLPETRGLDLAGLIELVEQDTAP